MGNQLSAEELSQLCLEEL